MPRKKKVVPFYKKLPPLSIAIAALLIVSLAFLGVQTMQSGSAARQTATPTGFYLDPSSARVKQGQTLSVRVYANSGSEAANVAQAKLQYPASQLEYLGLVEGTTFPTVAATDVSTPGIIQIARGTIPGGAGVTGSNVVVTINFRVLPTATGNIPVSFDSQYSFLVKAADNANMLTGVTGATYKVAK